MKHNRVLRVAALYLSVLYVMLAGHCKTCRSPQTTLTDQNVKPNVHGSVSLIGTDEYPLGGRKSIINFSN